MKTKPLMPHGLTEDIHMNRQHLDELLEEDEGGFVMGAFSTKNLAQYDF